MISFPCRHNIYLQALIGFLVYNTILCCTHFPLQLLFLFFYFDSKTAWKSRAHYLQFFSHSVLNPLYSGFFPLPYLHITLSNFPLTSKLQNLITDSQTSFSCLPQQHLTLNFSLNGFLHLAFRRQYSPGSFCIKWLIP